ncbi:DUF6239 family natural product biosynthesis protein [Amycolatopsis sp. WGS_07]|uniref:DUF6239 family natural product biosynthesis protein n=1 Tax=Amycolatopsis sp. WGS_07 TaxID=3076764 RepID=UPI00387348EF
MRPDRTGCCSRSRTRTSAETGLSLLPFAAQAHDHPGVPASAGAAPVAAGVLLFVCAPALIGFALLRPFLPMSERWVGPGLAAAALGVAAGEFWIQPPDPLLLAADVVLAATALVAGHRAAARRAAAPVTVAAAIVAAGLLFTALVSGAAFPLGAGLATGAVSLAWFARWHPTRPRASWVLQAQAVLLALVMLAGLARAVIGPAGPTPGVPAVIASGTERVLVVPQRPGWNLVQATDGVAMIGADPRSLRPAEPRPGTGGVWAEIQLPAGASTLWLQRDGRLVAMPVDTGRAVSDPPPEGLAGPDGPECALGIAGAVLAGRSSWPCPSVSLAGPDAAALRATIAFVARRGDKQLLLDSDDSPRSAAAARVVRESAAAAGIAVSVAADAGSARLPVAAVGGWAGSRTLLEKVARGRVPAQGVYLAPWLVSRPLLAIPAGQLFVLPYDPGGAEPRRYAAAVADAMPSATPCATGYAAWLGRQPSASAFRVYAASTVDLAAASGWAHTHADAGGWFPGGAVVAISSAPG